MRLLPDRRWRSHTLSPLTGCSIGRAHGAEPRSAPARFLYHPGYWLEPVPVALKPYRHPEKHHRNLRLDTAAAHVDTDPLFPIMHH